MSTWLGDSKNMKGGWVGLENSKFGDVQYCIHADNLVGSEKFQHYADVIFRYI